MDLTRGLLLVAVEATKAESSGLRHWLNENVGVITAVGVAATIVYVGLTYGLLRASHKERKDNTELLRSEQARLIAGYIDLLDYSGSGAHGEAPVVGYKQFKLTLVNASPLPVRRVVGRVYRKGTDEQVCAFEEVHVLRPDAMVQPESYEGLMRRGGQALRYKEFPEEPEAEFELRLRFDDDAGVTWEKYGPTEPLRRIEPPRRRGGKHRL
jgi:hypothetical protein